MDPVCGDEPLLLINRPRNDVRFPALQVRVRISEEGTINPRRVESNQIPYNRFIDDGVDINAIWRDGTGDDFFCSGLTYRIEYFLDNNCGTDGPFRGAVLNTLQANSDFELEASGVLTDGDLIVVCPAEVTLVNPDFAGETCEQASAVAITSLNTGESKSQQFTGKIDRVSLLGLWQGNQAGRNFVIGHTYEACYTVADFCEDDITTCRQFKIKKCGSDTNPLDEVGPGSGETGGFRGQSPQSPTMATSADWSIQPNPFRDELVIESLWEADTELEVHLFDIRGQLLLSQRTAVSAGQDRLTLSGLHDLPTGLIAARVVDLNSGGVRTDKLLKIE